MASIWKRGKTYYAPSFPETQACQSLALRNTGDRRARAPPTRCKIPRRQIDRNALLLLHISRLLCRISLHRNKPT